MDKNNISSVAVSTKTLLRIHIIIPILLILVLVDQVFFSNFLQPYLQVTTTTFGLYLLFFDLPHILASFVSYADREYLTHYKRKIIWVAPLLLVAASVYWYNFIILYGLYVMYTMYHVIRQQTGVTGMLLKKFSVLHSVWSWLAIVAYSYSFFLIYDTSNPAPWTDYLNVTYLHILFSLFLLSAIVYGIKLTTSPKDGWYYFILTTLVVSAGYVFILMGYPFLAILVVRFVHDITAFVFYAVHDTNRNRERTVNAVYKILQPLHLPLLITTPLIAIVVAAGLRYGLEVYGYASFVIVMLGFVHYYIESFMWKRTSLHREYIKITN